MKTKKLSTKTMSDAGLQVIGGTTGAMVSDGVAGAIPSGKKNLVRAGIATASLVALAATGGKQPGDKFVQSALLGVAIKQGVDLLRDNLQRVLPQQNGQRVNKFLHDALGNGSVVSLPQTTVQAPAGSIEMDDFALAHPGEEEIILNHNSWAMA